MDWVKVTPETMPPNGECVFVTALNEYDGQKMVIGEVAYTDGEWKLARMDDEDIFLPFGLTITHWAHYPAPAED